MSWWLVKKPNSKYWFARIKVPGRAPFDRSTHTNNRRTAERVAERLERDALVSGAPVSLEKALTMLYQLQVDKGDSPHTLKRTEYSGGHLCGYFGRSVDARSISLTETTKYMRARRAAGIKDSTIYRELRTLKEAMTNLKRHGLYDGTPSLLWPGGLPQTFAGKTRWLPEIEVVKLLDALPEFWRDHVTVYVFAGLRRGELFRLERDRVDFARERLRAPRTKTKNADKWMPMHPMVADVLKRRMRLPGALFPVGERTAEAEALRMNMAIRRAARKAGIAHCSPNDLRRTFCSWCKQNGVSEGDCADWLGHKNSKMVREVYGHDSAENAARKIRAVPSLERPTPQPPKELN